MLRAELTFSTAPLVLASDAAGAAEASQTPHGAFCIGAGLPPSAEVRALSGRLELRARNVVQDEKHWGDTPVDGDNASRTPPVPLATSPEVWELFWRAILAGSSNPESPGGYTVDANLGVLGAARDTGRPLQQTLYRTCLPNHWFSADSQWTPMLARKWRHTAHISRGELRAPVIGLRGLIGAAHRVGNLSGRTVVVGLNDNQCAASCWARGRSSCWDMNRLLGQRASLEGAYAVSLLLAWVDTHHQPMDGGTRPDALGKLSLEAPTWFSRRALLEIALGSDQVTKPANARGLTVLPPWRPLAQRGRDHDLTVSKNRSKLFSLLSSGHVAVCWLSGRAYRISPASGSSRAGAPVDITKWWGENCHFIAQALCVHHDRGGIMVIELPQFASLRGADHLGDAVLYTGARIVHVHCRLLVRNSEVVGFSRFFITNDCSSEPPWPKGDLHAETLLDGFRLLDARLAAVATHMARTSSSSTPRPSHVGPRRAGGI